MASTSNTRTCNAAPIYTRYPSTPSTSQSKRLRNLSGPRHSISIRPVMHSLHRPLYVFFFASSSASGSGSMPSTSNRLRASSNAHVCILLPDNQHPVTDLAPSTHRVPLLPSFKPTPPCQTRRVYKLPTRSTLPPPIPLLSLSLSLKPNQAKKKTKGTHEVSGLYA